MKLHYTRKRDGCATKHAMKFSGISISFLSYTGSRSHERLKNLQRMVKAINRKLAKGK